LNFQKRGRRRRRALCIKKWWTRGSSKPKACSPLIGKKGSVGSGKQGKWKESKGATEYFCKKKLGGEKLDCRPIRMVYPVKREFDSPIISILVILPTGKKENGSRAESTPGGRLGKKDHSK